MDHLYDMTPQNSRGNPWFMHTWMIAYNCSYDEHDTNKTPCGGLEHMTLPEISPTLWLGPTFDGIYAVAHGLHNMITDKCPAAFQNVTLLKDCVAGADLLSSIKNFTFEGSSWTIAFDELGDIMSPYKYQQYYEHRQEQTKIVATWDKIHGNISILDHAINWSDYGGGADVARDADGVPDSVCSYLCGPRQYQQQRELVCCWDCMSCRNNEIINVDRDGCEKCPELMWPDDTAMHCERIEPE